MYGRLALFISLGPLFLAPEALASPRDPAAAEALFEEGRTLLDAENFRGACDKFSESQRLDPGAGTLLNLATCEEKLGKTASAWQHFREAADALPAKDERVPFARDKIIELEKRLPWLTLRLDPSAASGALVLRDGVPLESASLGVALPIDPGEHAVVVKAPQHAEQRYQLTLGEGEQKALVVQPGPPVSKPTLPSSKKPLLGWALVGAGGASIGVGVVTAFMVEHEQDVVDAHCTNKRCDSVGMEAAARGDRLVWINAVALGAGAAVLGTGVVLVVTSPKQPEQPSATKVSAEIRRGGAFVGYGGSF